MEFLGSKKDLGEVYLTGDFNARTGSENNEFYLDTTDENKGPDWRNNGSSFPIMSNRTSKDTVVNKRGKDFIDLLACTKLSLLNGCTIGDVSGEFTYAGPNGKSVVDYAATSQNLKNSVKSFVTKFSDHKPCLCSLDLERSFMSVDEIVERFEDVPRRYK